MLDFERARLRERRKTVVAMIEEATIWATRMRTELAAFEDRIAYFTAERDQIDAALMEEVFA